MDADRDVATIQAFIVGRLPDDERRAFEDRLVRDPQLVRELEQSLRMREGFQQLRTQGYLEKTTSRSGSFRIWIPALAAAAAAGFALFLWLSRVAGPAPILTASAESHTAADVRPLVAAHFTFLRMRSGSVPDLNLPPAGLIEIRATPSTRQAAQRYRVTLVRQNEEASREPVAALAGLALTSDGYVRCYADAARLVEGSYVLRLEPETNTPGMVDLFPFNLRTRDTGSPR
jgi:hypothetical protein